ncbi:MAG: SPOR domain-containing protein [Cyanobacteria bacterium P01_D01_bin.36]
MASVACLVATKSSYAADCVFFSEPQRFNTTTVDDVIVIGRQPNSPYRVLVVSDSRDTLTEIRACVLDAFATKSRFGRYIQIGSFSNRSDAEAVHRVLRRSGYPSRVTYSR